MKARYQGSAFYFREGLCWSDINTIFLKCRKKQKSINDVKSMSLYTLSEEAPEDFIITILNSSFISYYVDTFVNNTQTFQINDARAIPVILPSKNEIAIAKNIVKQAINFKKNNKEKDLIKLQQEVDLFISKIYGFQI